MADPKNWKKVEEELVFLLGQERNRNRNFLLVGGLVAAVVAIYLLWVGSHVRRMLDPDELAEATSGAALEAVPQASAHLRSVVVDGAPDVARLASNLIVDTLPTYRQVMEEELSPVVDEICGILAQVAVDRMVKAARAGELDEVSRQAALQDAADAVVTRLDGMLTDALDEPMETDGTTPRTLIAQSLDHLEIIDSGLQHLVRGRGDPAERDLILGWLNLLAQHERAVERGHRERYRATGKTPE